MAVMHDFSRCRFAAPEYIEGNDHMILLPYRVQFRISRRERYTVGVLRFFRGTVLRPADQGIVSPASSISRDRHGGPGLSLQIICYFGVAAVSVKGHDHVRIPDGIQGNI